MTDTWITADTHFGHKNIIEYCNRPFSTVEEMDEKLIRNWNNTVSKNDKVLFLGDFAFGSRERVIELGNMLNGRKTIVLGNHDRFQPRVYIDAGFESVTRNPILYDGRLILSHEPIFTNISSPYINLFGHVHNNGMFRTITPFSACVCVERWDYKPIKLKIPIKGTTAIFANILIGAKLLK